VPDARSIRRHAPVLLLLLVALVGTGGCGDHEPPPSVAGPNAFAGYGADGTSRGPAPAARNKPNIVLIVLDTLRRDALANMPFLTELAGQGVRLADATAPSSWTLPSITSLLTGLLPSEHGADTHGHERRLPPAITTFAEVLQGSYGYETAALMDGLWFGSATNTLQGFHVTRQDYALQGTEQIIDPWLKRRRKEKPFFLVLHTMEAHDPYGARNHPWPARKNNTPETLAESDYDRSDPWSMTNAFLTNRGARERMVSVGGRKDLLRVIRCMTHDCMVAPRTDVIENVRAHYEAGTTWVDGLLRKTHAALKARGLLENTILIVTSDHGEAFGEHGILGHGRRLDEELIGIPMVICGPPPFDGGRIVRGEFGLIDVMPTLFDWMGIPALASITGRSVLPLLEGKPSERAPVVSEVRALPGTLGERASWLRVSVRSQRWKHTINYDIGRGRLTETAFDIAADPSERFDLAEGTGVLPASLPFDAEFCRAIDLARDRVWAEARRTAKRAFTVYGVDVAPVTSKRPPSCDN